MEYDLRTLAGDLTVEQTMLCGRPKERWSGVEQNLVELTPAQRANVFEFDGMHASFEASWDVCTPTGVTPVQGCLTVWAQGSGSFLGRVRGYWFASKHAEDLLQRGPDAYSIFALMLNEEFGNMAQALCAQLGERQPQSPVVFAHCVERHPQRSSPGLGVAMLVEFVKRVREMEPLIDTVAINVEPAQFVLRPGRTRSRPSRQHGSQRGEGQALVRNERDRCGHEAPRDEAGGCARNSGCGVRRDHRACRHERVAVGRSAERFRERPMMSSKQRAEAENPGIEPGGPGRAG